MNKIMFIVAVLSIIGIAVVSGCVGQTQAGLSTSNNSQQYTEINKNTSDPQSQYYDQMDDSFQELDYLDNLTE